MFYGHLYENVHIVLLPLIYVMSHSTISLIKSLYNQVIYIVLFEYIDK
jgi:hypothetical protein